MSYLKLIEARNWLARPLLAMLAATALLVLASCSQDDGFGKRYPVSGTVTYNGSPLDKAEIVFVTEDLKQNYSASGTITNGSYTLSTGGNADGAQAGKYKVTIKAKEDYVGKAQAAFQKESGTDNPKIPPYIAAKAEKTAKSLIPPGYGDPRTTTLSAEVKPEPNKIDFELSDSSAPAPPSESAPAQGGRGRGKR
jgi:hypothetical protein